MKNGAKLVIWIVVPRRRITEKGGIAMLVSIFVLVGAGISALIGAGIKNTDFGQKMDDALEDAVDSVKQVIGRK